MEQLGVDLKLLLTQVVNFAIMVVVLTKLLYRPIIKQLNERRQKIEAGLARAQKLEIEEQKLAKRKKELTYEAKEEARVLLQNTQKAAQKEKEEIIKAGKQEVEAMKQKLVKDMETRLARERREIMAHTVDIAIAMVRQVLPEILAEKEQHQLVKKHLKKLEKQESYETK